MARVKFYRPHNDRYETAKVEKVEDGIVYLSTRIRIGKRHVHKNNFKYSLDDLIALSRDQTQTGTVQSRAHLSSWKGLRHF